mmetsp:Transcript_127386/g.284146  ORF Transcript_127386/g.284146 Transcript_127386/m.284146 type:complete len:231 (+) Transcript_127386:348-1040(+)
MGSWQQSRCRHRGAAWPANIAEELGLHVAEEGDGVPTEGSDIATGFVVGMRPLLEAPGWRCRRHRGSAGWRLGQGLGQGMHRLGPRIRLLCRRRGFRGAGLFTRVQRGAQGTNAALQEVDLLAAGLSAPRWLLLEEVFDGAHHYLEQSAQRRIATTVRLGIRPARVLHRDALPRAEALCQAPHKEGGVHALWEAPAATAAPRVLRHLPRLPVAGPPIATHGARHWPQPLA